VKQKKEKQNRGGVAMQYECVHTHVHVHVEMKLYGSVTVKRN
jgi:hypothetical protein